MDTNLTDLTTSSPTVHNITAYCDITQFTKSYRGIHGYLSLLVCCFGSIANVLNIAVLTRKDMRIPTNMILAGLAVADLFVMLEYIPYSSHNYMDPDAHKCIDYFSYNWSVYMYFHALFTQVFHFIACCLTVILAIWRYVAITHPEKNLIWCTMERTKLAILLCYILCPFICTPLFLGQKIEEKDRMVFDNCTMLLLVQVPPNNTAIHHAKMYYIDLNPGFFRINLWLYGVIIKLLPSILLTALSICLVKALLDSKKRWKTLSNNSGVPLVNGDVKKQRNLEKNQQVDRTTRMLLAILFLFLLAEIPQSILGLLSVILGHVFFLNCYNNLGELLDIAALVNSAINFILYCSMSKQFRDAFRSMFCSKDQKLPHKTHTSHETNL